MADPNSPSQQLVGAVLNGRFRLLRLLGEGGMGAVFEADSTRGEGKRAIKLLHQEFSREEQILQRFFAEAQTSQSLNHPNIARVYESARAEDGTPYLVMELLTGMPLSDWIDSGSVVSPQTAAPIIYGVLQALHVAHQRRVIHRDLKPDNLFMTRDPSGQYVVKVLDFGIAKVMDAAGGMGNKTRTGVLLGTPGYMSPEQIKNSKAVDARSDLWAVGIIFYEMLTQKLPFHAENEFARLTAVLTDEPTPIEQAAPSLTAWSGFFRKALQKEPQDRFQTAEEMGTALMNVMRGGSMSGAGPNPPVAPVTQQQGNATIAMAAVPEWNTGPAAASPGGQTTAPPLGQRQPDVRPGTGTVPSNPSPLTFAGAGQHPHSQLGGAAPGTMPGGHQQPLGAPMMAPPAGARQASGTVHSAGAQSPSVAPPPMDSSGRGPTHVSAHRPPGVPHPSHAAPNIQVVDAPPLGKQVPLWLAGAIGGACLVVGFLIGFLVGR